MTPELLERVQSDALYPEEKVQPPKMSARVHPKSRYQPERIEDNEEVGYIPRAASVGAHRSRLKIYLEALGNHYNQQKPETPREDAKQ